MTTIAKISVNEGVCLEGRWKGWLFRQGADGQWVSVRKLDEVEPMEGNPFAGWLSSTTPSPTK